MISGIFCSLGADAAEMSVDRDIWPCERNITARSWCCAIYPLVDASSRSDRPHPLAVSDRTAPWKTSAKTDHIAGLSTQPLRGLANPASMACECQLIFRLHTCPVLSPGGPVGMQFQATASFGFEMTPYSDNHLSKFLTGDCGNLAAPDGVTGAFPDLGGRGFRATSPSWTCLFNPLRYPLSRQHRTV
jgi:hypothetical protein